MKSILLVVIYSIFFFSCTSSIDRVDTGAVKEQMKQNKIVRITNAKIDEAVEPLADELGNKISSAIENEAKTATKSRLLEIAVLKNIPIIDSIKKQGDFRVSLLDANSLQDKTLSQKELEVLDAYAYSIENKQAISKNIQLIGNDLFICTMPINNTIATEKLGKKRFCILSLGIPKAEVIKTIKK